MKSINSGTVTIPSLLLMILLIGFPQISETIYTPSLPDLAKGLGIHIDQAEFTLSIYFVGFAVGVFVYGCLADLLGRRPSMLLGLAIYILASLGCSFTGKIEWLLFFRFFQAFGAASGSVVTQTMLRDVYSGAERSKVFSMISAALAFSPAVGPLLGGFIDQLLGWRSNFHVLSMMGVILGLVCLIRLPETRPAQSQNQKWGKGFGTLLRDMARDRKLISYGLLIGGINGIIFSYYAEAPFIFVEILGLTPAQYGLMGLLVAASFFLASLLSVRLIRTKKHEKIIFLGTLISAIGSLTLWISSTLIQGLDTGLAVWIGFLASLFIIFIGVGIMIPNCISYALTQYQSRSGTAGSIFGGFYYLLIAGFTWGIGMIHNGSPSVMPIYFLFISIGMMWVCLKGILKEAVIQPIHENCGFVGSLRK